MAHNLSLPLEEQQILAANPNAKVESTKYNYFGVGTAAWHGLGKTVEAAQNAAEAIKLAGLDFEVVKRPVQFVGLDGKTLIDVPGKYATVRTDTQQALGVVGDTYEVMQNSDLLTALDPIIARGEAIYQTAGSLGIGEKNWLTAKLPEHYDINVGVSSKGLDVTQLFLLLYGSHDGSSSTTVCLTPVRVVCNNTLTAALRHTKNKVTVRHTKNAKDALLQAHQILGISDLYKKQMEEVFNAMAKKQVTKPVIEKFLLELYPKKEGNDTMTASEKIRRGILQDFDAGRGAGLYTANGTAFGLYNAVTHYLDQSKGYESADARMKSVILGGVALKRQKAFDLALALV